MSGESRVRVGIIGATGYTGAELLRILSGHRRCELVAAVGYAKAGESLVSVLPGAYGLPPGFSLAQNIEALDIAALSQRCEVVFLALPHGKSTDVAIGFRELGTRVIDLSADFRLGERSLHDAWYELRSDKAQKFADDAVYGLVEASRAAIQNSDLIAVPGCYPTATSIPLIPLYQAGLLELGPIIVDAKSGVSGAGRSLSLGTHYAETNESMRAYKVGRSHRHTPEIEQTLSRAAGSAVPVLFTPQLVPMLRGILSCAYVRPKVGVTAQECMLAAQAFYQGANARFVRVLACGECPSTGWAKGSNLAFVSYTFDAHTGFLLAQGAIDNLVKGAAGQAVQCLNVRYGWPEDEALTTLAIWP